MDETNKTPEFFEALMDYIMLGTMIPKVQIERNVGPIIGFFLAEALSKHFDEDIITLCPEFPIRKTRLDESSNNQSTNIDWLMYSRDRKEIIFLELKTADTSYKHEQAEIYRTMQQIIRTQNSARFLLDELQAIAQASSEGGKYRNIQSILNDAFGDTSTALQEELSNCKRARLVYLAPEVSRPSNWTDSEETIWLSFSQLPETLEEHSHGAQWPILRKHLVRLDSSTQRLRNGDTPEADHQKNYRGVLPLDKLLEHGRTQKEPFVVGLMNWRAKLPSMTLSEFQSKSYKWDFAAGGVGKKIERNWIRGDEFIAHVNSLCS